MDKFKHKNGTGTLFTNDKKTTEKQPSMRGSIVTPDGTEYRISAWKKDGKNGEFFSLAVDTYEGFKQESTTGTDLPF